MANALRAGSAVATVCLVAKTLQEMQTELADIPLDLLLAHPDNSNFMRVATLRKLRRHIERTGRYEPLTVRPHPRANGSFEIINGHNRLRVLRVLRYQTACCMVWDIDDDQTRLYVGTLNRLCGSEVPERRAVLLEQLLAVFEVDRLADLLHEDRKRIEELGRLSRLELDDSPGQKSPEVSPQVRVAHGFMLGDSESKELDLALDLILSGEKGNLSRSQAVAHLARFYLGCHRPVRAP